MQENFRKSEECPWMIVKLLRQDITIDDKHKMTWKTYSGRIAFCDFNQLPQ